MKKKFIQYMLVLMLLVGCNNNGNVSISQQESNESSLIESSTLSEGSTLIESSSLTESSIIESSSISSSQISDSMESSSSSSSSEEIEENQWTNDDFKDYYKSINLTSTSTLLSELRKLNKSKKNKDIGYKNLWDYFNKTDYDPNNSQNYLAFYRGTSASRSQMNKEHVWPKSRGGNLVDGDIHMVRPTLTSDNSNRGNSFYVEGKNSSQSGWDPKAAKMNEVSRGQAARIIFYCVVANEKLSLVDKDNDSTSNNTMGKLSDLLRWNLLYPVDDSELRRNNGAQIVQGNRNPFIDNPSFACAIFGSYNENTKKICSSKGEIQKPDIPPIEEEEIKNGIKLTVDSLNIPAQTYLNSTQSVDNITFNFTQIGNYGDGIQMRDKNGNTSILLNTTPIQKGIRKIVLNYSTSKSIDYDNNDAVKFYFGDSSNVNNYLTTLSTKKDTKKYEIIPDKSTYTYFKMEHDLPYSFYWDNIIIYYGE